MAADQRHLRDGALHPAIDRAHHENMAAAVTSPPDADALCVSFLQRLGVGDGVAVVSHLPPGVDLLTRRAVTGAEVAVVEYHRGEARRREGTGEAIEIHLLNGGEAVRHDDGRHLSLAPVRYKVPAAQGDAILGSELDILAHDRRE